MSSDAAVVVGTRPEAIKLAPVVQAMRGAGVCVRLIGSGQHRELLEEALSAFGLTADVDLKVMRDAQDLAGLTSRLVASLDGALGSSGARCVLVQGDTTTTMAAALVAFYRRMPCLHVEAGLRSHDREAPWPEEMNRRLADQLCTRHYPPTEGARRNLIAEGIHPDSILVTGQTGVDAALLMAQRVGSQVPPELQGILGPGPGPLIYATGHRRESFDGGIAGVAAALKAIVEERPDVRVVFPAHPNPNVLRQLSMVTGTHDRLHIIRPVSYPCSVWLMSHASAIVSDSGGIQEEAPSFGVPVLVTRDVTERPEGVASGFLRIVGTSTGRVLEQLRAVLDDPSLRERLRGIPNPYGDGAASRRIAEDVGRVISTAR